MNTTARDERENAMLEADAKLRATDVADLLRAAYALTHRMGVAHDRSDKARRAGYLSLQREQDALRADLRAQRDLIDAEIERRCAS